MTAVAESPDLIKLPVSRLALGMYVTAIDQQGKVTVVNAGLLKHKDAITHLVKSGIRFVWVDAEKSLPGSGLKKAGSTASLRGKDKVKFGAGAKTKTKLGLAPNQMRQQKAKNLLFEAKGLIRKVLGEVFEGKAIEVAPFEALADNLIESVMSDAGAMQFASALRSKDAYLLEHSVNVAVLLVTFGRHLGFDATTLKQLAVGGILHDIGKIKVDNQILHKPGKLSEEEFEHMKLHQVYAIDALAEAPDLHQISKDVCLMHHEKLDGRGYPNGLKGDEIPLHGRMSGICDIYDALTATRCYKEAMSPASAFKILLSLTPHHLDQKLVYEFIRCVGVYPVGSLVELSDGRVGIVWETNGREVRQPIVKCFYSLKLKRYTQVAYVDLLKSELEIERGVTPGALEVDPSPFY
ncbi:HD-GYP domain-containing protein [Shewanella corallii]|uniref:HD-GYP domain-containing protein n=1 Tax=Shewanella corallii TaxID=560080 RepID=A0ABT0NCL2_9GAMM|nr:HD-GYP domain-containing protein [Shewanella corallii]MCL2916211.1 HD-GYP domain-containing protein [Shewanella corallii]